MAIDSRKTRSGLNINDVSFIEIHCVYITLKEIGESVGVATNLSQKKNS